MAKNFRSGLVLAHKWIGIVAATYFCCMSLTGVSLVFRDELEELLVKEPHIATSKAIPAASNFVRNVKTQYPEHTLTALIYPLVDGKPLVAYARDKEDTLTAIWMDPGSAAVLGNSAENPVLKFVQEFHINLLAKTTGRKINAIAGLVLVFLSLSGIVLFCRGVAYCLHTLRMKWKGSARVISWSNHQKLGTIMLPMLLVWGVSAFSFGFHNEFEEIVNVLLPVTGVGNNKLKEVLPAIQVNSDQLLMLDSAEQLAFSLCPGQKLSRISMPGKKADVIKLWLTKTTSNNKADATEIDLNIKTGKTIAVIRPESRSSGDAFLALLPRLHFGNFAGLASKTFWCIIGFTPFLMSITGMIMWWSPARKHRAN